MDVIKDNAVYGKYFSAFWFPLLGSLVFAQIYRFVRMSNPMQREQTKWVVFAVVAVIVGDFAIFIPPVICCSFPALAPSHPGDHRPPFLLPQV